jgi:hypothetical protein
VQNFALALSPPGDLVRAHRMPITSLDARASDLILARRFVALVAVFMARPVACLTARYASSASTTLRPRLLARGPGRVYNLTSAFPTASRSLEKFRAHVRCGLAFLPPPALDNTRSRHATRRWLHIADADLAGCVGAVARRMCNEAEDSSSAGAIMHSTRRMDARERPCKSAHARSWPAPSASRAVRWRAWARSFRLACAAEL